VPGYPDTGGRCYMMNEQLSWLTPFSQQVAPGLAWRSRGTELAETLFLFAHRETPVKQLRFNWAGGDEQKICTFGYTNTTHWNEDFRYAPALILFVCRRRRIKQ
jgi:hypothetical protein